MEHEDLLVDVLTLPTRRDQDRIGARVHDRRVIVALADGAGGMAHGELAASHAMERALAPVRYEGPVMNEESLRLLDMEVARLGGETTLVAAAIQRRDAERFHLEGVSVGDSHAFARVANRWVELTEHQHRKRVGSGRVRGERFCVDADRLIIASDGMLELLDASVLLAAETLAGFSSLIARHDDASCLLVRALPAGQP